MGRRYSKLNDSRFYSKEDWLYSWKGASRDFNVFNPRRQFLAGGEEPFYDTEFVHVPPADVHEWNSLKKELDERGELTWIDDYMGARGAFVGTLNLFGVDLSAILQQDVHINFGSSPRKTPTGYDLTKSNLIQANGEKLQIDATKFHRSVLDQADFSSASLGASDFTECNLSEVVFKDANLQETVFLSADINSANFSHANLIGADFSNSVLTASCFDGADLRGADLGGVQLSDARRFKGAVISKSQAASLLGQLGLRVL